MKPMKKLMKNKKGFTLMEMLIVIAIIVILVAIAVPTFTSQLSKANSAANDANMRAAKAQAAATYLADTSKYAGKTLYFDAVDGTVDESYNGITAYGKGDEDGNIIKITIDNNGVVTATWVEAGAAEEESGSENN
ncbi:MAG: prepilin-type N-terminal cleavage/methylation domain-containing protein [Lachnospiraceae bacterium]|nr:prepilin-type N-terminal cleavage/methylation domain-containing protein [Lachnospiraceae bacterium]